MDELLYAFEGLKTIQGEEEYEIIKRASLNMSEKLEDRIRYIHDAFVRYNRYIKYVDFDLYPWINNPVKEFLSNYPYLSGMTTSQIIEMYKMSKTIDHMIIVRFEDETRDSKTSELDEE